MSYCPICHRSNGPHLVSAPSRDGLFYCGTREEWRQLLLKHMNRYSLGAIQYELTKDCVAVLEQENSEREHEAHGIYAVDALMEKIAEQEDTHDVNLKTRADRARAMAAALGTGGYTMTPEQIAEGARSLLAEANALLAEREKADRRLANTVNRAYLDLVAVHGATVEQLAKVEQDAARWRAAFDQEHERAERLAEAATREAIASTNAALNAQDAARWRAVRKDGRVIDAVKDAASRRSSDSYWPATVDEAADRLIAEQEATP